MQANFDPFKRSAVATAALTSLARAARSRSTQRGQRTKPIEDIQIGDLVWAWDEALDQPVRRPVVRLFRHQGKLTVAVTVAGDDGGQQRIECTTEHPFWVEGKGWVAASELVACDLLKPIGDSACQLRVASSLLTGASADVFNFEVAGVHNYFVGQWGVLVHNQSDWTADDAEAPAIREMRPTGMPYASIDRYTLSPQDKLRFSGREKVRNEWNFSSVEGDAPLVHPLTQTEVALTMLNRYTLVSKALNREFGGHILRRADGTIYAAEPRIGVSDNIWPGGDGNAIVVPDGHKLLAYWHTHPGAYPRALRFSFEDKEYAHDLRIDAYVGLQDGRSLHYDRRNDRTLDVGRDPIFRSPSEQNFFAVPDRPIPELLGIGTEANLRMRQPSSPHTASSASLWNLYLGDPALVGEPLPMRVITPPPVRWQGGKLTLPSEARRTGQWIGSAEPPLAFDVPQRFVPTKAPPPAAPEPSMLSDPDFNPFAFE